MSINGMKTRLASIKMDIANATTVQRLNAIHTRLTNADYAIQDMQEDCTEAKLNQIVDVLEPMHGDISTEWAIKFDALA